MSDVPYPINTNDPRQAVRQMRQVIDELFQERLAGATVGDVFEVGENDVLTLRLSDTGGLQKTASELEVKTSSTGAITSNADGLTLVAKPTGGLSFAATGVFVSAAAKGDLIVGTAATEVAVLGIGSAGQILKVGGAGATGLEWSNPDELVDIHLSGDGGGVAATTTFTGVTDTPTADPGWASSSTIDMTVPDGYIKAYIGLQAVVIPYWNT